MGVLKRLVLVLSVIFLSITYVEAAPTCSGSGPTYQCTAESCSVTHIQAAVDLVYAAGGGTVNIPVGTCDHDGSALRMSDGINLIGAGQDQTTINNANINICTRFYGNLNKGFRVSGMSLLSNSHFLLDTVHNFRFDHMTVRNTNGTAINISACHTGVIDHSQIIVVGSYYGIGISRYPTTAYPECWSALTDLISPAGQAVAIYVEDNEFTNPVTGDCHFILGHGGAHYVSRHNTFTGGTSGQVDAHGPGYGPPCGTRLVENYSNIHDGTSSGGSHPTNTRGGAAFKWNNLIRNFDTGDLLLMESSEVTMWGTPPPNPTPTQPHLVYSWGNTFECPDCTDPVHHILGKNFEVTCINSDYLCDDTTTCSHCAYSVFQETAGIDVRSYILLNRDYFFRAPTQELDGFTYTPYTYPHPLVGGGGSQSITFTGDKSITFTGDKTISW